jgi:hypothetical protein
LDAERERISRETSGRLEKKGEENYRRRKIWITPTRCKNEGIKKIDQLHVMMGPLS